MAKRKTGTGTTIPDIHEALVRRCEGVSTSGKLKAFLGHILGKRLTTPWVNSASVTSDGFVVVVPCDEDGLQHSEIFGSVEDLVKNVAGFLHIAAPTQEETAHFLDLYNTVPDYSGRAAIDDEIADLLAGQQFHRREGEGPGAVRRKISLLREMTVERGCSVEEADAAVKKKLKS